MEIFSILHLLPPIYHIFTCVDPDPGSYSEDGSGFTKLLNRYRYGSNLDPDQPQATTLLNIEEEEAQNYQTYRTVPTELTIFSAAISLISLSTSSTVARNLSNSFLASASWPWLINKCLKQDKCFSCIGSNFLVNFELSPHILSIAAE